MDNLHYSLQSQSLTPPVQLGQLALGVRCIPLAHRQGAERIGDFGFRCSLWPGHPMLHVMQRRTRRRQKRQVRLFHLLVRLGHAVVKKIDMPFAHAVQGYQASDRLRTAFSLSQRHLPSRCCSSSRACESALVKEVGWALSQSLFNFARSSLYNRLR